MIGCAYGGLLSYDDKWRPCPQSGGLLTEQEMRFDDARASPRPLLAFLFEPARLLRFATRFEESA